MSARSASPVKNAAISFVGAFVRGGSGRSRPCCATRARWVRTSSGVTRCSAMSPARCRACETRREGATPSVSATTGWERTTEPMRRWASAPPISRASGSTPMRSPWSRTRAPAYEW